MATIKKYNGSTWENAVVRKYGTASEIITPPTTIYADGSNITIYTIKGNTVQNDTPTPSNPVPVVGVGELETTGEHSGEYKIPIPNGQQTTNIYLGSTQTVRAIKKLVLDGTESWDKGTYAFYYTINDMYLRSQVICTHFVYYDGSSSSAPISSISTVSGVGSSIWIKLEEHGVTTTEQWKSYLATQYANGTPVTVWYVLATATTGVVNEPLHKIGGYADSLSNGAQIPTTEGANQISIGTTVQPSEFTATYTGWHDASVKEKSENLFDIAQTSLIDSAYLKSDGTWEWDGSSRTVKLLCDGNTQYTISIGVTSPIFRISEYNDSTITPSSSTILNSIVRGENMNEYTFTTAEDTKCLIFQASYAIYDSWINSLMFNEGQTAIPYEPYWK